MSAMPCVHLMRFGWRSLPLVATQFPCMAMVIQGTKSVEFGESHLEYRAGQYLLTSIDVPATSRIVNASKTHPLLAVGCSNRLRGTVRSDPALRRAAAIESSTWDDDLRRGCRAFGIRRSASSLAGHAATFETVGSACPAGDLVSPALGSFRFPAAGDLPKRQSVQSHCRGGRLDKATFCRGVHGGGTGASRWDEPDFIPPALQSRHRHDADSVSTAHPSSGGEEKPAHRVNQHR